MSSAELAPVRVLMVCLGNICRSPTAEGVLVQRIVERRWQHRVQVDSAGTSGWHIDEPPDPRTRKAALARGYDLSQQRGRALSADDFARFDYILAMDQDNLRHLRGLCPASFRGHLGLLLDFADGHRGQDVPDPYHGGAQGFELVLDLVERAVDGLLDHLNERR